MIFFQCDAHIKSVLRSVRKFVQTDVAYIAEIADGQSRVRCLDAADPIKAQPYVVKLHEAIHSHLRSCRNLPISFTHIPNDLAHDMCGAFVAAPIRRADGSLYGCLALFDYDATTNIDRATLDVVELSAELYSRLAVSFAPDIADQVLSMKRLISVQAVEILFQPIYRLSDDKLVCLEALSRFEGLPYRSPEKWLVAAEHVGLRTELEFMMAGKALSQFTAAKGSCSIAINLSPDAILNETLKTFLEGAPLKQIVLEITENAPISNYAALRSVLAPYRSRGLRLAIDDVGAGYASFRHVVELSPDIIKLDMYLTRNIHRDRAREALAVSITRFSRAIGCQVVAEGVEVLPELEALRTIGVTKVQGYLFGRPQPVRDAVKLPPCLTLHANGPGNRNEPAEAVSLAGQP